MINRGFIAFVRAESNEETGAGNIVSASVCQIVAVRHFARVFPGHDYAIDTTGKEIHFNQGVYGQHVARLIVSDGGVIVAENVLFTPPDRGYRVCKEIITRVYRHDETELPHQIILDCLAKGGEWTGYQQ